MTSPTHATNISPSNPAATIVDIGDFDTHPGTPTSPSSRACCGIARGLRAPLITAAASTIPMALGIYNAVTKHQSEQNSTGQAFLSAAACLGIVSGTLALGLSACLAKEHFDNNRANDAAQHTLPVVPGSPRTPQTPMPASSYTVVTQPNQEIALAVQTPTTEQHINSSRLNPF